MTERIRTTISIDPDVLELFQRMSALSGVSVSRCMGDWFADTRDGAEHVFNQLRQAKDASRGALSNLHARLGSGEILDYLTTSEERAGQVEPPHGSEERRAPAPPGQRSRRAAPSSNTGLKSTGSGKSTTSGKP